MKRLIKLLPIAGGFAIGLWIGQAMVSKQEASRWKKIHQIVSQEQLVTGIDPSGHCYFLDSNKVTGKWEPDTGRKVLRAGQAITMKAECLNGLNPHFTVKETLVKK